MVYMLINKHITYNKKKLSLNQLYLVFVLPTYNTKIKFKSIILGIRITLSALPIKNKKNMPKNDMMNTRSDNRCLR